jgi:osmotically-inducible protein OsmY
MFMTDKTLQLRVLEALDWEPSIKAEHISVTVEDGIVTLKGHVESYYAKSEAVTIAQAVAGVKAVVDQLEVSLPSSSERHDEDLAHAILNALNWHINVPKQALKVIVSQGHVNLKGEAEWQYQRLAAEHAASNVLGVRKISNEIRLVPKVSSQKVHDKIEAALRRNAELEAKNITVEIHGSTVTLKRKVHSFFERQQAERAAWAAPGVTNVQDNLVVTVSA